MISLKGLVKLYHIVPESRIILKGIEEGREMFISDLKKFGFEKYHISKVHPESDLEVQSFILAIPSIKYPEEIVLKTYATYSSHFMDDYMDGHLFDDRTINNIRLVRKDLNAVLKELGVLGDFCHHIASVVNFPAGMYKAEHRIIYGGLIQQANKNHSMPKFKENQNLYLNEHLDLAIKDLDKKLGRIIKRNVDPLSFFTTTKTVQEHLLACEDKYMPEMAELYNLLSGPALYYHNSDVEMILGEMNFHGNNAPTDKGMANMIDIFNKHIGDFSDDRLEYRIKQVKFFINTFDDRLPKAIRDAYGKTLEVLKSLK